MKFFVEHLLVAIVTWMQVSGQSNAASNNVNPISVLNQTTTAVPLINASTTVKTDHTPSVLLSTPSTVSTTENGKFTTKTTYNSESTILSKLTSIAASPTVPVSSSYSTPKAARNFPTTTAAPPFVGPEPSHRRFDALSFMGGVLLTVSVVILGTYAWKMYMARIDRSYWTL